MRTWVRSVTMAVESEMPMEPATLRNMTNSAEASPVSSLRMVQKEICGGRKWECRPMERDVRPAPRSLRTDEARQDARLFGFELQIQAFHGLLNWFKFRNGFAGL